MKRNVLLACLGVAVCGQIAAADRPAPRVTSLRGSPATRLDKDGNLPEGCGLYELPDSAAAGTETPEKYDAKALEAAGASLPAEDPKSKPMLQEVWSWCVTPSLGVRVWSVCRGTGDTRSCALYAAKMTKGKLDAIASHPAGWSPPRVESIDSSDVPPKLWSGQGLKVITESGKGNSVFGVYVGAETIHFTPVESAIE